MEADLEIRSVRKRFGAVDAVKDASLQVGRGEILAFLGPSGCGKSTLLQIIAGFVDADAGDIFVRGRSLTGVPAHLRRTGLVFQHYALFPNMTVRRNIEYGLRAAGEERDSMRRRVAEAVALLKLDGLEERYPNELSGGQKQRVAIARTLAIRPDVLLLDEALSALDKNLREAMQIELSVLLRQLQITTILVTHDQREAFGIADRIAVMEAGRIVQTDAPEAIYHQPRSAFILSFLGSSSELPVDIEGPSSGQRLSGPSGIGFALDGSRSLQAGKATLYLRAEEIRIATRPTAVHASAPGSLAFSTFLGSAVRYVIDLAGRQIVVELPPQDAPHLAYGANVYLDFDPARAHILQG